MKIDRLMGILTLLSQREKVTAPELAERFEVSRRTINRDLEKELFRSLAVRPGRSELFLLTG